MRAAVLGAALVLAGHANAQIRATLDAHTLERRLEVVEHDGGRLRADGARLLRMRDGEERALACTLEGGPGRILEIVTQAYGASFLASERGIFTISPEVEHLDPIHRLDGTPEGAPTGIALSPDGRTLWVASARGLGCVDLVQFYGTRVDPALLPAGTIEDVDIDEDGKLRVQVDGRVQRLELPARPEIRAIQVSGEDYERGQRIALAARELRLAADVASALPTQLRVRVRGRHLWRPLAADGRVARVEPGAQSYDVVAIDSAMQRSPAFRVDVTVPYPQAFEKRTLLAIALGFLATLCLGFAWLAGSGRLRARSAGARWYKAALSVFAAFVVSVQIATGIEPHARSWPFVGFTMYTEKYEARSSIFETKFVGLHRDGTRSLLDPLRIGRHVDGDWVTALPLLDAPATEAPRFVDEYQRATGWKDGRELVGMQVVEHRKRLTARGPIDVAPIVWMHWRRP